MLSKHAQISSFSNISDLELAVLMDKSINEQQRREALNAIRGVAQSNPSMSVGELASAFAGTTLGVLLARYLNMNPLTQALSGALGFGIGRSVHTGIKSLQSAFNYSFNPYRG